MNHLWQRFLLASSLLVGLAIGVGATVFGYSNLQTVDVNWSVFHLNGVPLWTVVLVPIGLLLIAGTLYHWLDGLHHFTEHMRHRHRVRELEAEVARLRAHLDQVLEMPRGEAGVATAAPAIAEASSTAPATAVTPSLPAADLADTDKVMAGVVDSEPVAVEAKPSPEKRKRPKIVLDDKPLEAATNGADNVVAASASGTPEA